MSEMFKAVKISNNVYWVGAIDWDVRDFHGMSTNDGTTYNAYLITSGKTNILIDTVKKPFYNEMMQRIASVVNPKDISVIISNHAEPDHSSALGDVIKFINPKKVYASLMGQKALEAHYPDEKLPLTVIKDGETLKFNGITLTCYESRMLHWPDSMVTYYHENKVLFSNDIFGMHIASSERFEDEVACWEYEAMKYYANIILPYSKIALAFIKKVLGLHLDMEIIAPDHGPVWRKDIMRIVKLYEKWATQPKQNKALVVFDTMWHSTEKIARALSEGLSDAGTKVIVMKLQQNHRSDIMTELMDASAIFVGGPTMNKQIYPTLADFLIYMKGLEPQNLTGAVFGSYGWAPHGIEYLSNMFKDMGISLAGEPISSRYVPSKEVLDKAYKLGIATGQKILRETSKP